MRRASCDCPHGFPVCACREGLGGLSLWIRSRQLSALAGWPARPTPDGLAFARSQLRPLPGIGPAQAVALAETATPADCGCGPGPKAPAIA